jgi:hypothetical protein
MVRPHNIPMVNPYGRFVVFWDYGTTMHPYNEITKRNISWSRPGVEPATSRIWQHRQH